ncbi:MAG: protease modulator HflC [Defluviitaleaceae bacterium]|nr:protease modulator HflC [Defluviitaleaceae bacterium]
MKIISFVGKVCRVFIIALISCAILFNFFTVTVPAGYAAYVMRFGKAESIHTQPGLYMKLPIDTISYIPINKQIYNIIPTDVITLDKKTMNVSSFVIWQITNPRSVIENLGSELEVNRRIDNIVYNAIKNTMSSRDQLELITQRGDDLSGNIRRIGADRMAEFGVDVSNIKINKFDLPDDNKEAVYRRMISERDSRAAKYLAEGEEEAKMIRNSIRPERDILISTAQAEADRTRAEGEAEYMRILSEAFSGADRAEFYEFLRSLDALKVAMQGDKTVFLPLDSPLTKWLAGY